ncbi:hypothetical protein FKM82_022828 [Ascaphus truei]
MPMQASQRARSEYVLGTELRQIIHGYKYSYINEQGIHYIQDIACTVKENIYYGRMKQLQTRLKCETALDLKELRLVVDVRVSGRLFQFWGAR